MSTVRVCVVIDEPAWKKSGVNFSRLKTSAKLAVEKGMLAGRAQSSSAAPAERLRQGFELTLFLANDERLRALNVRFRRKDSTTDVLSFPAAENPDCNLGDIAVAIGAASRDAASAGITLEAHTLHLVAHGALHLLGYDHLRAREARVMQKLETGILSRLGIADPYAPAVLA